LIDGGLWRACKESREAIAKHTRFYDWARVHKQAIAINALDNCRADWAGGDVATHPASIETSEGEGGCQMLVYPYRDIFCIEVDDWKSLQRQLSCSDLEMTFVESNNHHSSPRCIVKNIAVQFDDSWLDDIPTCLLDLQDESSARGFFGSLLLKYFISLGHLEALWIIDKEAWWYESPLQDHDTVYRDGDEEYFEVNWSHIIHLRPGQPSASAFMGKIRHFLMEYPRWNGTPYLSDHRPRDIFRLLVRRDHRKKDPRAYPRAPLYTTQNAYGLVIYSDDPDRKNGGREDGE
jgi:hypothetical protein